MLVWSRLDERLDDQRHVFLAGQLHLLALPQRVVYRERVDGHRQVLRVHLREALAARVVPMDKFNVLL